MRDVDQWLRCSVFGDTPELGNPALVVKLAAWPDDSTLKRLASCARAHASEVSEVTFVCVGDDAVIRLRWFGPLGEVPDCGHGTLAAVLALKIRAHDGPLRALVGPQGAERWLTTHSGLPTLGMPRAVLRELPNDVIDIGLPVARLFDAGRDYLAVVDDEAQLRAYRPDIARLMQLPRIGLTITAPRGDAAAYFRFFAPRAGIPEDLGSASVIPSLVACWFGAGCHAGAFVQRGRSGIDLVIPAHCTSSAVYVCARVHELEYGRVEDWSIQPIQHIGAQLISRNRS
jgi:predicted PhzF superfamily epimerase YddE/YHI9